MPDEVRVDEAYSQRVHDGNLPSPITTRASGTFAPPATATGISPNFAAS